MLLSCFQVAVSSTITGNNSICSTAHQYNTGDVCKEQLHNALKSSNCLEEGRNETLFVLTNATEQANVLTNYSHWQDNSSYCKKELLSLVCLDLFGLCSSSSVLIQTNRSYCWELEDSLCRTEWEEARRLGLQLPECDSLPLQSPQCHRNTIVYRGNESNTFGNITHKGVVYDLGPAKLCQIQKSFSTEETTTTKMIVKTTTVLVGNGPTIYSLILDQSPEIFSPVLFYYCVVLL